MFVALAGARLGTAVVETEAIGGGKANSQGGEVAGVERLALARKVAGHEQQVPVDHVELVE